MISIQNIINKVNHHWSKDLKIRFLYVNLAPYFQRDLNYFLADDEEKFRQYSTGFINRSPYIVCYTLAEEYIKIFNQFDIRAIRVRANSTKIPLFALIVEGDFGWYFLDPLNDLFRNQYGLKAQNFGIIPYFKTINNTHPELIELPPDYIDELDKELGLQETYINNYLATLHPIFTQYETACKFFEVATKEPLTLIQRKLQFYNEQLINIGQVKGTYEREQLYLYLNSKLFNSKERKNTDVQITGINDNPHISIEISSSQTKIIYEEQIQNDKFVLTKNI